MYLLKCVIRAIQPQTGWEQGEASGFYFLAMLTSPNQKSVSPWVLGFLILSTLTTPKFQFYFPHLQAFVLCAL